ncbi:hypothetical protein HHI36_019645 [Cryptolaemus montrouzieri]|uniref:Ionotropic receptor n=1 Tax=Cryptolaemus montrouzieri TaxID=559131 RepID=A0ABD2N868_9CUCU
MDFFILDSFNDTQVENIVQIMRRLSWFHPAAKFLIVGTNFSSAMLKYIAKYHVINVTILDSSSGNISTTYPYKTRSLQRINTDPSLIGYCNDSLLDDRRSFISRKIPTYWKKTYLRLVYEYVEIFSNCVLCEDRYKGIESEIFIIIFEHLEMRLKAVKYTFSEGSAGYLEVLNCETDMIFGLYARVSGYKDAEVTSPYLQEHMLWFIPVAPEIPRWKYIFHIFHKNVVIAFLVTIMAISLSWLFKNYTIQRNTSMNLFFEINLSSFELFLGQSHRFYTKSLSHKILVCCIILLSTMMNYFFGTRLAYLLNGKSYETKIESVEQLAENNFYVAYYLNRNRYLVSQISAFRDYPEKFYVNCSGRVISCIDRMRADGNMALVGAERQIIALEKNNYSIPPLVSLKEHLYTINISAFFSKGYPLFSLIDRMLQYLVQSGIVERISKKYHQLLRLNEESLSVRSLSIQHMVLPLFVWFVGIFLSVVVFCNERIKSNQGCLTK